VKGSKMAEIKSTLDLVMERTRGLSLSDRERGELRSRELQAKVKSVLERFISEYQGIKWMKSELGGLGLGTNLETGKAVKSEFLARLSLTGENGRLFDVLEKVLGEDTRPYKKVIAEFRKAYTSARQKRSKLALEQLATLNISGTAVKPNLGSDPGWKEMSESILSEFRQKAGSL